VRFKAESHAVPVGVAVIVILGMYAASNYVPADGKASREQSRGG